MNKKKTSINRLKLDLSEQKSTEGNRMYLYQNWGIFVFLFREELREVAVKMFLFTESSNLPFILRFRTNRQTLSSVFTHFSYFHQCVLRYWTFYEIASRMSRPRNATKKWAWKRRTTPSLWQLLLLWLRDKTRCISFCLAVFPPTVDLVIE